MAKIVRKTAQIFAQTQVPVPANQIAEFGTKAGGAPAFSGDPAAIQTAEWLSGWTAAVLAVAGGVNQPCLEDRNAVDYVLSYQIAYLMQSGIAEWDADTTYFNLTSWCTRNGTIYQSTADNNINNDPAAPGTPWQTLAAQLVGLSQGIAKAWVYFDGTDGSIITSYNVTGITVLGVGNYLLSFPGGLLVDANYMVQTSTSNDMNPPYDPFGRWNGDIKTAVALQVRNLNGNGFAPWGGNQENYVAIYR